MFNIRCWPKNCDYCYSFCNELWVKRYNGPGNDDDSASAITADNLLNVYVTGGSYGSGIDYDYATIKYDPDGNELWVKRYDGPGNYYDYAEALAVDGADNVYVTGGSHGSGDPHQPRRDGNNPECPVSLRD